MEATLAAWVRAQHAAKVCVTGEIIKMEQAVAMMDESDDGKSTHTASDADEDCYVKPPSIEEKLKALSITNWILQDRQCADKAAIRGVVHAQMHLRH